MSHPVSLRARIDRFITGAQDEARITQLLQECEEMANQTTARCQLCQDEVPAVPANVLRGEFPAYDGSPNPRMFHSGPWALLHHVCPSMQANARREEPYFDYSRSWWACQQPKRPLDADVVFDVDCLDCARRWETA